ncbi:MAG: hypothetical protein AAF035_08225, partial [Pseudomonadota bacterium]
MTLIFYPMSLFFLLVGSFTALAEPSNAFASMTRHGQLVELVDPWVVPDGERVGNFSAYPIMKVEKKRIYLSKRGFPSPILLDVENPNLGDPIGTVTWRSVDKTVVARISYSSKPKDESQTHGLASAVFGGSGENFTLWGGVVTGPQEFA